LLIDDVAGVKI